MAWDIVQLHNQGWIKLFQPECATAGASPECHRSVQVGNQCYYAGSANYVVFGVMFRSCFDHFVEEGGSTWTIGRFSLKTMQALIKLYKSDAANFRPSQAWATAGWNRWPDGGTPPKGDRSNCAPVCPITYLGKPFQVNWFPQQFYTGEKKIIPPEDETSP
jgi:hypothetical protein